MYEYLLTSNGKRIYCENINNYYYFLNKHINNVKGSAKWNIDAQNGNFEQFIKLIEYYKLSTPDGKKLTEAEVRELMKNAQIGSENHGDKKII